MRLDDQTKVIGIAAVEKEEESPEGTQEGEETVSQEEPLS